MECASARPGPFFHGAAGYLAVNDLAELPRNIERDETAVGVSRGIRLAAAEETPYSLRFVQRFNRSNLFQAPMLVLRDVPIFLADMEKSFKGKVRCSEVRRNDGKRLR